MNFDPCDRILDPYDLWRISLERKICFNFLIVRKGFLCGLINWKRSLADMRYRISLRSLFLCMQSVFVIANISPRLYSLLELNPYLILHGQVWRIVTFLLIRTRDEFDLCNICIVILLLDRKLIRAGMGNIPIQYVLSDRSFRNDRWGIFNLCDSYISHMEKAMGVC